MGALLPSLTMAMTLVILMGPSICALQLGNAFPGHPFTQFSQEHPQVGEDRATTQRSYLGTSSYTDVTSLGKGSHRWWCGVYFLSFLAAEARTRDETSQSLSSPVCKSGPLAVPRWVLWILHANLKIQPRASPRESARETKLRDRSDAKCYRALRCPGVPPSGVAGSMWAQACPGGCNTLCQDVSGRRVQVRPALDSWTE